MAPVVIALLLPFRDVAVGSSPDDAANGYINSSGTSSRNGSPARAPTCKHFCAATKVAKRNVFRMSAPHDKPFATVPMNASPAPVVSTMSSLLIRAAG